MNTSDNETCETTIQLLEDKLAQKSKDLKMQVMYNGLTLLMGLVIGFAFAKLYRFRSIFRNSK